MNHFVFFGLAVSLASIFGQGQIRFETDLRPQVDVPVFKGSGYGPGPAFSAQLYLLSEKGTVTPLGPATTFRAAGSGIDAIADHYVKPVDVTVPNVPPGSSVTLMMRAWRTALGSYENSVDGCDGGQSLPFTITLGGGDLPPAPLSTLTSFGIGHLECSFGPPAITGISIKGGQIVISTGGTTEWTRLLASTNLQSWTDLNLVSTPISVYERTFTIPHPPSYQYYRLLEP